MCWGGGGGGGGDKPHLIYITLPVKLSSSLIAISCRHSTSNCTSSSYCPQRICECIIIIFPEVWCLSLILGSRLTKATESVYFSIALSSGEIDQRCNFHGCFFVFLSQDNEAKRADTGQYHHVFNISRSGGPLMESGGAWGGYMEYAGG